MKTRQGFVSNSSTTSFLIYGTATSEDVWSEARAAGLQFNRFQEYADQDYAVGLSWDQVGDDETGAEFKARVEALVKKVLPEASEFCTLEDAYYDG